MAKRTFSLDDRADRLVASWIGGVIVPAVYFWVAWLALSLKQAVLGKALGVVDLLITLPIFWPYRIFLHYFPPNPKEPFEVAFAFYDPRNLLMMIVGNFILYSIVSYGVLSYVHLRRRREIVSLEHARIV